MFKINYKTLLTILCSSLIYLLNINGMEEERIYPPMMPYTFPLGTEEMIQEEIIEQYGYSHFLNDDVPIHHQKKDSIGKSWDAILEKCNNTVDNERARKQSHIEEQSHTEELKKTNLDHPSHTHNFVTFYTSDKASEFVYKEVSRISKKIDWESLPHPDQRKYLKLLIEQLSATYSGIYPDASSNDPLLHMKKVVYTILREYVLISHYVEFVCGIKKIVITAHRSTYFQKEAGNSENNKVFILSTNDPE